MAIATTMVAPAAAQPAATDPAPSLWEIGAFGVGVSQPAYPGSSERVARGIVLPYGIYRGQFLRAERDNVGLRAVRTPRFEFDVGLAGSLGSSSDRVDARRGMEDLGYLIEAGPRLKWNLLEIDNSSGVRAEFVVRGVFDLSDELAYKGVAFEPRLVYERRPATGLRWTATSGLVFGDRRLADTFYGVAPQFATPGRPAYDARAGLLVWRSTGSVTMPLTRDLRVFMFVRADSLHGSANCGSPLSEERFGVAGGLGLTYTFLRSGRSAFD